MADAVLPATSIPPIAENCAERPKFAAAIVTVLMVLFGLGGISLIAHPEKADLGTGSAIGGVVFWVMLFLGLRLMFVRKAKRLLVAAARAKTDPGISWFLRGHRIIATDANGAPDPKLSFKIRQAHVEMLSVLPDARVV